ncbi:MAG TPA: 30S ribosomal protein S8 [Syntrophales bacterium]|nr:30S ribosomal protein S8 [Syntrophales bacterium]HNZ34572.1 30S ribosomal protein S8 [Syntrophales bacterium]HOF73469.1 30S ribosomal protein S8 [Syntrophales bacterium]HOH43919.1 30S ribosomal protein S8 [Syntrophales bacterium]HPG71436.1 30S ribosomal protein S8 [Syntrophales bacterium]
MTDPIADMLTRVRNANRMKFRSVNARLSRVNLEIVKVLKRTGYISGFDVKKDASKKDVLKIYLKYTDTRGRIIQDLQRVSKPGRRIYVSSKKIPRVYNGFGVAIVSTSRGIMTDKEARQQNVGGEILCNVW